MIALARRLGPLLAPWRGRALGAVLLGVATLAAGIGLMGTSAWLIATAALHPSIAALQVAVVAVRGLGLTRGLSRYGERLATHDVTLRVLAGLRALVIRGLARAAPDTLSRQAEGDLLATLVSDVETLEQACVRVLAPVATALAAGTAALALLAWVAPPTALVLATGLLTVGLGVPLVVRRRSRQDAIGAVTAHGRLQADAVDAMRGARELVANGRRGLDMAAHAVLATDRSLGGHQLRLAHRAAAGAAVGSLVADLSVLTSLLVAVALARVGTLSPVQVAVIPLLVAASFEVVAALPAAMHAVEAGDQAGRRLDAVTGPAGTTPAAAGRAVPPIARHPECRLTIGLRCEAVSYRYPESSADALGGLSLDLQPGRLVAVVGASGSGKSTLLQLLLGTRQPTAGTVTLDGCDVATLPDSARWADVTWVPQRPVIMTGTLAENLRLASPGASDAALWEALGVVGMRDLVAAWPGGLSTALGELGERLSGGEQQRLALARAHLGTARYVLLDEPAAALDPESERAVLDALRPLSARRGVLLVSHRLAGLSAADEIVVLGEGRVVDRGTFAELEARDGWFHEAWRHQRAAVAAPVRTHGRP